MNHLNTFIPSILLDVKGVTFGYENVPLLYDVHLEVRTGEMVGLLGPNGSGKTTLLRLVSGVLRPQQGTVVLEGRNLQDWGRRGVARNIAVVPQELHVPEHHTGCNACCRYHSSGWTYFQ